MPVWLFSSGPFGAVEEHPTAPMPPVAERLAAQLGAREQRHVRRARAHRPGQLRRARDAQEHAARAPRRARLAGHRGVGARGGRRRSPRASPRRRADPHGPSGSRTASIAARRWRAMPARPPSSSASRCAEPRSGRAGHSPSSSPKRAVGSEEVRRAQVPRRRHDADARGHAEGQDDRQRPRRVLRRVAARHLEQHRHVGQRPLAPHLLGLRQAVGVGVAGEQHRAHRRLPAQRDRARQARARVRGDAVLGAHPGLAVAEDDGHVVAVATAGRAQAAPRPRGRTGRSGTGGRAAARPARRARSAPRGPHAAPRPSPRRSR